MGMGYSAAYCDVVQESFVKKTVPKEWHDLETRLTLNKMSWEDLARGLQMEQVDDDVWDAYDRLTKAFEKKTKLYLALLYHNSSDEGDRYDDVDGMFWGVDGVHQYTPAGEKYKGEIERKFYVQFG